MAGCIAHARNGRISTSGLKSDVTIVFLGPNFRLAVDMDIHGNIHGYIHGYIHVWISDLGHAVDISMDI